MSNVFESIGNKLPGADISRPMRARRRGAIACLSVAALPLAINATNITDSERVCTSTDGVAYGYSGWDNAVEAVHQLRDVGVEIRDITTVSDYVGSDDIQPIQVCINKYGNYASQNLLPNNVVVSNLP